MDAEKTRKAVKWLSGICAVVGIWLLVAPLVLQYAGLEQALWNDLIAGGLIALLSLTLTLSPPRFAGIGYATGFLGSWLVFAPFVLGYGNFGNAEADVNTKVAIWNDIFAGALVLSLSAALVSKAGKA